MLCALWLPRGAAVCAQAAPAAYAPPTPNLKPWYFEQRFSLLAVLSALVVVFALELIMRDAALPSRAVFQCAALFVLLCVFGVVLHLLCRRTRRREAAFGSASSCCATSAPSTRAWGSPPIATAPACACSRVRAAGPGAALRRGRGRGGRRVRHHQHRPRSARDRLAQRALVTGAVQHHHAMRQAACAAAHKRTQILRAGC